MVMSQESLFAESDNNCTVCFTEIAEMLLQSLTDIFLVSLQKNINNFYKTFLRMQCILSFSKLLSVLSEFKSVTKLPKYVFTP